MSIVNNRCPMCMGNVHLLAKICPHCQTKLEGNPDWQREIDININIEKGELSKLERENKITHYLITFIFASAILLLIFLLFYIN